MLQLRLLLLFYVYLAIALFFPFLQLSPCFIATQTKLFSVKARQGLLANIFNYFDKYRHKPFKMRQQTFTYIHNRMIKII